MANFFETVFDFIGAILSSNTTKQVARGTQKVWNASVRYAEEVNKEKEKAHLRSDSDLKRQMENGRAIEKIVAAAELKERGYTKNN